MRKIGFVRQDGRVKEILPHSYHIHSLSNRRKMFLSMLNAVLPKEAHFEFSRCSKVKEDVYTLLQDKVMSFLPMHRLRPETSQPIVTILIHESGVINRFLQRIDTPLGDYLSSGGYKGILYSTPGFTHPSAALASLMMRDGKIEMMLDLDELFTQTVFKRIKPQEGTIVTRDESFIHISSGGQVTRLHPRWKRMNSDSLNLRKGDINTAFDELRRESINAYYLVYPKMDDFTRHILIKNSDENPVKIIPYSFTFCTKEKHV
ncbi:MULTISPECIES: hypothetical protein [unclassified Sulfuricurvum]|uniref:hypothetical protein n=1 Tax=unclassified Sulfuricurvum TaxID=2632390 RepID=UPI000299703B|nr:MULTISPECIES: hypothetical protein [unclassified Sulfuricurvum]OHD80464.1 MAG: hypothetical protein A3D90_10340 [Sulfuricurvum sp. RIFCSPHIGHO2_02_FULL_43_9]OHD84706.1 MAG: hypothetical protein A2Y52_00125 [Sulfuricurvum sp. RIFCSPLOWO2_02_43_6]AFV97883.1 hypothetical protein B649_07855 [Candidatus Sulfuricurvum sp. RIFRC-1]OHD88990.1 MAG: hypothetical protein A3G19_10405 [Sulfuricurvum sp. RIFCSPLOWO2_12_FULL_43_24]HBM35572.1 hypothetical protein [Sulfuricurvum sp.]